MLPLVFSRDDGIKIRWKVEHQCRKRKGQRPHAAVDATVKDLKMTPVTFNRRVVRNGIRFLHQSACLTCHQHKLTQWAKLGREADRAPWGVHPIYDINACLT